MRSAAALRVGLKLCIDPVCLPLDFDWELDTGNNMNVHSSWFFNRAKNSRILTIYDNILTTAMSRVAKSGEVGQTSVA
jgi:hypothetical protein